MDFPGPPGPAGGFLAPDWGCFAALKNRPSITNFPFCPQNRPGEKCDFPIPEMLFPNGPFDSGGFPVDSPRSELSIEARNVRNGAGSACLRRFGFAFNAARLPTLKDCGADHEDADNDGPMRDGSG